MTGCVLNIQRFSIDDGPGIRTTVFLKGCNLHCQWCHNPESINRNIQIQFYHQKCTKCGDCCVACPSGARFMEGNEVVFNRELCRQCKKCVEVCQSGALMAQGQTMSVNEVVTEVLKDQPFYIHSGGGVTFSGGEPLLQNDFLLELLKASKEYGLHTAIDTAGNVPWSVFTSIMNYVDLFLYDIKLMNNKKHKLVTGVDNGRILENLKMLADNKALIHIRVPVIPGTNDNMAEMKEIAGFLQDIGGVELIELLPYHGLGESKYDSLGEKYNYKGCKPPEKELMKALLAVYLEKGLNARV